VSSSSRSLLFSYIHAQPDVKCLIDQSPAPSDDGIIVADEADAATDVIQTRRRSFDGYFLHHISFVDNAGDAMQEGSIYRLRS